MSLIYILILIGLLSGEESNIYTDTELIQIACIDERGKIRTYYEFDSNGDILQLHINNAMFMFDSITYHGIIEIKHNYNNKSKIDNETQVHYDDLDYFIYQSDIRYEYDQQGRLVKSISIGSDGKEFVFLQNEYEGRTDKLRETLLRSSFPNSGAIQESKERFFYNENGALYKKELQYDSINIIQKISKYGNNYRMICTEKSKEGEGSIIDEYIEEYDRNGNLKVLKQERYSFETSSIMHFKYAKQRLLKKLTIERIFRKTRFGVPSEIKYNLEVRLRNKSQIKELTSKSLNKINKVIIERETLSELLGYGQL